MYIFIYGSKEFLRFLGWVLYKLLVISLSRGRLWGDIG